LGELDPAKRLLLYSVPPKMKAKKKEKGKRKKEKGKCRSEVYPFVVTSHPCLTEAENIFLEERKQAT